MGCKDWTTTSEFDDFYNFPMQKVFRPKSLLIEFTYNWPGKPLLSTLDSATKRFTPTKCHFNDTLIVRISSIQNQ